MLNISLTQQNTAAFSKAGSYYAANNNGVEIHTPLVNLIGNPSDLIAVFKPRVTSTLNMVPFVSTTINFTPSIHVIAGNDNLITSGLYPRLIDQGMVIAKVHYNQDTKTGILHVIDNTTTYIIEFNTYTTQNTLSSTDEAYVNAIPNRFLMAKDIALLDDASSADIDVFYYENTNTGNAIYLPIRMGTSLTFTDLGNRLDGYMKVPDMISDQTHPSMLFDDESMPYLASVDCSSFNYTVFTDADAYDIVANLPDTNGSPVRWLFVCFRSYAGSYGSPMIVKVYNIHDGIAECVNMYRSGTGEYTRYENGSASMLEVDETFFKLKPVVNKSTDIPSVASRALHIPLIKREINTSATPSTLSYKEILIQKGPSDVDFYIPSHFANLDFREIETGSDVSLFKLVDPSDWALLENIEQVHVAYSDTMNPADWNDVNDSRMTGIASYNSLLIVPQEEGVVAMYVQHVSDGSTGSYFARQQLNVTSRVDKIAGIVSQSGSTRDIAFNAIRAVYSNAHYFAGELIPPAPSADPQMVQSGIMNTDLAMATAVEPRTFGGIEDLRSITVVQPIAHNSAGDVLTIDIQSGESTEINMYGQFYVTDVMGLIADSNGQGRYGSLTITILDSSSLSIPSEALTSPSGIVMLNVDFDTNNLQYGIGQDINNYGLTSTNWTELVNVKLEKSTLGTKVSIFVGAAMISTSDLELPWSEEYTLHISNRYLLTNSVVAYSNLAFYPRGTAITSEKMLPLVKRDGVIDSSVVTWDIVEEADTQVSGADLIRKIVYYIPKFFMDDNPYADGVYELTMPDNMDNMDLLSAVLPALKFVMLSSLAAGSTPVIGQYTSNIGDTYITIIKVIDDYTSPLKVVVEARYGDTPKQVVAESIARTNYSGTTIGEYNPDLFTDDFAQNANANSVRGRYPVVNAPNLATLPTVLDSSRVYKHMVGTDMYLIMNAGILLHNRQTADTVCVLLPDVASYLEDLTHWVIIPDKHHLVPYVSLLDEVIPPPKEPTDGILFLSTEIIGTNLYTKSMEYSVRVANTSATAWGAADVMSGLEAKITDLQSTPLHRTIVGGFEDNTQNPALCNLVTVDDFSSVNTALSPNDVTLTREGDDLLLLLPSAWRSLDENDNGITRLVIDSPDVPLPIELMSAILSTESIIIDSTTDTGAATNLSNGPDQEIISLIRNISIPNTGFTLVHGSTVLAETHLTSMELTPIEESGHNVSMNPMYVAYPYATYLSVPDYPHGLIPYDNASVMQQDKVYLEEVIDGSDHNYTLYFSPRCVFNNTVNNNFMKLKFTIESSDHASYVNLYRGICITRRLTDLSANNVSYKEGNIAIEMLNRGDIIIWYHDGSGWNDVLATTIVPVLHNTLLGNPVPVTSCVALSAPDDIYHVPVILKKLFKIANSTMGGGEIFTTLSSTGVTIFMPNTWLSLDREDTSIVSMHATTQASLAIHNAKSVVMYSGTKFGSITGLPFGLNDDDETVILSRESTHVYLYVIKGDTIISEEILTTSVGSLQVTETPVIPTNIPLYVGGFKPLTRHIGKGVVVQRTEQELGAMSAAEVSYTEIGGDKYIYFTSMVLSGHIDDTQVYRVLVDSVELRNLLETSPEVCLFSGPVSVANLDINSGEIYIGRYDTSHVSIVYNKQSNPYVAAHNIVIEPTSVVVPSPRFTSFATCDVTVGCDMVIQTTDMVKAIPINPLEGIPSAASIGYNLTDNSIYLTNKDMLPCNIAIPVTIPEDEFTGVAGLSFNFRRNPIGETSITPIGLPSSKMTFAVLISATEANRINVYGINQLPTSLSNGIMVSLGRYPGSIVVITNAETGEIIPSYGINPMPPFTSETDNSRNITAGTHVTSIRLVRSGIGTLVYVYINDVLIAYTLESVRWFNPQSLTFHYHSNDSLPSSELITDPIVTTNMVGLTCLPMQIDQDEDCLNKAGNTSSVRNMELSKDVQHMVIGLRAISDYGYLHVTLSSGAPQPATVRIYITDNRSPISADEIPQSPVVVRPGRVEEIALLMLRGDQKLFVQSNVSSVALRVFTMENCRE